MVVFGWQDVVLRLAYDNSFLLPMLAKRWVNRRKQRWPDEQNDDGTTLASNIGPTMFATGR